VFKSLYELSLGESETHKAKVAAEKRLREEEERRRQEEAERLHREHEEEKRLRLLEIAERRRREEELYQRNKAERRRRLLARIYLGIKVFLCILLFLFMGWLGFVAWNYQERHPEIWDFVPKRPFIPETAPLPSPAPALPKQGEPKIFTLEIKRSDVRSAGFQTCSEIGEADFENINGGKATIPSRFGIKRSDIG
jgi:hypothetical protein